MRAKISLGSFEEQSLFLTVVSHYVPAVSKIYKAGAEATGMVLRKFRAGR